MKGCNIYLALIIIQYKYYKNLQSLLVFTYSWKDLLINFVTDLPILMHYKKDGYDLIFVIINWFTKIVYYKPFKVTINTLSLVEVIINIMLRHHSLLNLIVIDQKLLFTSKFWLLLCYFFDIKQRLFIAFYLQTNCQTKKQNNIIEAYLQVFLNF